MNGSRRREEGSVTAETAMVLPVLVLILTAALWGVACVGAQLRCVDVAREAARAAARGEALDEVHRRAEAAAPEGADVEVEVAGRLVTVTVETEVAPLPGWPQPLPELPVSGTATTRLESVHQ